MGVGSDAPRLPGEGVTLPFVREAAVPRGCGRAGGGAPERPQPPPLLLHERTGEGHPFPR